MTTYTVIAPGGTVIDRNLTALQAMREILTYDGYAYRFRRDKAGNLYLYHSDGSANSSRGARHFVRCVSINSPLPGIAGQREQLLLKISETYDINRADAQRELKAFEERNKNYRPK